MFSILSWNFRASCDLAEGTTLRTNNTQNADVLLQHSASVKFHPHPVPKLQKTSNSIRPSYTKLGTGLRQRSIQRQYYRMFCCKWFVIWYLFGELWGNATFARTLDEFHRLSSQPSPKVDFSGKQSHIFENLYASNLPWHFDHDFWPSWSWCS